MFLNTFFKLTLLFAYTLGQSHPFYLEILAAEKTLGFIQHRSDSVLVVTTSRFKATLFSDGESLEPAGYVPVNDPELGPQPEKKSLVLFDNAGKTVGADENHRLVVTTKPSKILGWYSLYDPIGYEKLDVANQVLCKFKDSNELYHAVFTGNKYYYLHNCWSVKLRKVYK